MSTFDQTARQGSKLDGAGFYGWFLSRFGAPPSLVFDRWEDARRLASVPGLERVNDVVAVLRDGDRESYLITEMETEPRRHQLKRLGVYQLLLSIEVSAGPGPEEEPPVGVAVLVLTGRQERRSLALGLAGMPQQTLVGPLVLNLGEENADATLQGIEGGQTARCILPWIPLMAGGGDPGLIARWKQAAEGEPDEERRAVYGDLARTFAELTPALVAWQQALEGWQMRESQFLKGYIERGKLQGWREAVLDLISPRLANPVPEEVRLAVEGTNDPDTLRRWHRLAETCQTLDEFLAGMAPANEPASGA
jgi:hypothetical protein